MAELKTQVNDASVEAFIQAVDNPVKREDGFKLLEIFSRITGEPAKMWGTSIIGFGQYHYKSERSSQEGDWMLTGFSPRKQNLSLYILSGPGNYEELLKNLGKHKTSSGGMGGCLYINKLADVDLAVLEKLIEKSFKDMQSRHA